jgi:hypothetical protein
VNLRICRLCMKGRATMAIYVASRASIPERSAMWRRYRDAGAEITSSWIDEAGEGETADFSDLWARIESEIERSRMLILYAESGDFPLKGALVEVGMALGMGKQVIACLPGVNLEPRSLRPAGSWMAHPLVIRIDDIEKALRVG